MEANFGFRSTREVSGRARFHGFPTLLNSQERFTSDPIINVEGFQFAIAIQPSMKDPSGTFSMTMGIQRRDRLLEPVWSSPSLAVIGRGGEVICRDYPNMAKFENFGEGTTQSTLSIYEMQPPSGEQGTMHYPSHEALVKDHHNRLEAFKGQGWVVDDTLTIELTMKIFVGRPGPLRSTAPLQEENGLKALSSNMKDLLEGSVESDITLVCKDGQHGAHRLILAMRSPVFRAMFQQGMQETQRGEVVLNDVDAASLRLFLNHMYCGVLPDVGDDELWALISLAHKYDVQQLLEECTQRWQLKLAPLNAAAIFAEADKLGIASLKQAALEFITQDSATFEQVQESDAFKSLPATLLQELLAHTMGLRKRKRESKSYEFPDDSEWESLTVTKIKQALSERALSTAGIKSQLIARLREHIAGTG